MYQNFFLFFTSRVRSYKAHTSVTTYILAVHDVTELALALGDCRSSARPSIENRQLLKSLPRWSQRLKSLLRRWPMPTNLEKSNM